MFLIYSFKHIHNYKIKIMNRLFILLLFIVIIPQTSLVAQLFGEQNVLTDNSYSIEPNYINVKQLDINNDGFDDTVIYGDIGVATYFNNGTEISMTKKRCLNFGLSYEAFFKDMDADGDLDIVDYSINFNNQIGWFSNDGEGNFSFENIIYDSSVHSYIVEDVDSDGLNDLIIATPNNSLIWNKNLNDGGLFVNQAIIEDQLLSNVDALVFADIEMDGDKDIFGVIDNDLVGFLNAGNNTFTTNQIIAFDVAVNVHSIDKIIVQDIDNDGDKDFIANSVTELMSFINDGNLSFNHQLINSSLSAMESVYLTDNNNDGIYDIILNSFNSLIHVFNNDGSNNFSTPVNIYSTYLIDKYILSDIDNDGNVNDIICLHRPYSGLKQLAFLENDEANNLNQTITLGNELYGAYVSLNISKGDIDGDGDEDIVATYGGSSLILWYENTGNGFSKTQNLLSNIHFNSYPIDVVCEDIDLDGNIDVVASYDNRAILWFKSNGSGSFSEQLISDTSFPTSSITKLVVEDIDFDGDKDIINLDFYNDKVEWFENDGLGNFSSEQLITSSIYRPTSAHVFDFDNDGDNDILIASSDQVEKIKLFENDGASNFSLTQSFANFSGSSYSILSNDLDGDNDEDLILSFYSDTIIVFNNDNGQFVEDQIITTNANGAYHINLADLNNDGDMDLISSSSNDDKIAWYENVSGNFNSEQIISTNANGAVFSDIIDIDSDGDLDIISFSRGDDKIAWYLNYLEDAKITGFVFWDVNNNGEKDPDDKYLEGVSTYINPDNIAHFANNEGVFTHVVDSGQYILTYEPITNWNLNTDSSSYNIHISSDTFYTYGYDFGFVPTDTLIDGELTIAHNITRCDNDVNFNLGFNNLGTTIVNGTIWMGIIDSFTTVSSFNQAPDTTANNNGTDYYGWHFNALYPFEHTTQSIQLLMPGISTPNFVLGDSIKIHTFCEVNSNNNLFNFFEIIEYSSEVTCAYDPNDKLVFPQNNEESNFTPMGKTLIYTIRFQNTGTDTAFNVVVRDTLSEYIDASTFRILGSSHYDILEVEKSQNKYITFTFENIMLPDSLTNFEMSQGYVQFSVEHKASLDENTPIENSASIYFDSNPPIHTNSTLNTMFNCLPITTEAVNVNINQGETYTLPDGQIVNLGGEYQTILTSQTGCDSVLVITYIELINSLNDLELQSLVSISPNPTNKVFLLEINTLNRINYQVDILDLNGRKVKEIFITNNNTEIDVSNLSSSIYFVQIKSVEDELLAVKKLIIER